MAGRYEGTGMKWDAGEAAGSIEVWKSLWTERGTEEKTRSDANVRKYSRDPHSDASQKDNEVCGILVTQTALDKL